jgi:hypothetical protein
VLDCCEEIDYRVVLELLEMLEVLQAIVGHGWGGLHLHMHLVAPHDSLRLLPLCGGWTGRSVPMHQLLLRLQLRMRLHQLLLCLHLLDQLSLLLLKRTSAHTKSNTPVPTQSAVNIFV